MSQTAPATGASQGAGTQMQGSQIQYITQNRADLWRASKLEGLNVYNQNNEEIGDIREVLVNSEGEVEAVVIGVGGFLGIGERDVAVPFDALQWVHEERTAARTSTGAAGTGMGAGGTTATTGTGTTATAPVTTTAPANNTQQPATTGTVGGPDNRVAVNAGDQTRDYPERAILPNATKDQLKQAPQFQYSR
jgi:sporulation protein YlmC with PRC-barrel domain